MSKFEETKVVKSLSLKSDLEILTFKKEIKETFGNRARRDVGIKSRAKIDFLTNYCGWHHTWVNPTA